MYTYIIVKAFSKFDLPVKPGEVLETGQSGKVKTFPTPELAQQHIDDNSINGQIVTIILS